MCRERQLSLGRKLKNDCHMTEPLSLEINRSVPVERTPLGDGRSWVDLRPGFVPKADVLFESTLATTNWRQSEVWRFDHYVEERRLGARFRADKLEEGLLKDVLTQTSLHLQSVYRARLNGVAGILYRSGEDFQGLHSDRVLTWLDDTLIAILVLGERRPFRLRQRNTFSSTSARSAAPGTPPTAAFSEPREGDVVFNPGHGDLLVMGGRCQRDWLHAVPEFATENPRISLTWRWTSKRGKPDTGPRKSDGKHYSDRPRVKGTRSRPVPPQTY